MILVDRVLGRGRYTIGRLQEEACHELQQHIDCNCNDISNNRMSRLLLRLPALRLLSADLLEQLFFMGLIGNVQIDCILPFIIRMEPSEYTMHMGTPVTVAAVSSVRSNLSPLTNVSVTNSLSSAELLRNGSQLSGGINSPSDEEEEMEDSLVHEEDTE